MDYKEVSIEGTIKTWRRTYSMCVQNPRGGVPLVEFLEEDVRSYPDGAEAVIDNSTCKAQYISGSEFPILNPATGEPFAPEELPYVFAALLQGKGTHDLFYLLGYSLYMDTAKKRDEAEVIVPEEDPLPPQEPINLPPIPEEITP